MRKIIVVNIVSLDGYFDGPGQNVMVMPMDEAFDAYNLERMRAAGTVLLGGNSFHMFGGFWPSVADNPDASPTNREFSRLYNAIEKVAISNSATVPESGPWHTTSRVIGGKDVYEQVARLKEQPGGDIVMYASRTLWNDLMAHGLVDELHFMTGNVVLGGGTLVFSEPIAYNDSKRTLHLVDTRRFPGSDNVLLQYAVKYKNG